MIQVLKRYKVNGRGDIDFSISLIEYKAACNSSDSPPKKDSSSYRETPQKRPNDKKNKNKNRTHTVVRGYSSDLENHIMAMEVSI